MSNPFDPNDEATSTLVKFVLGFFGIIAAAKLLPRTFVFMMRRYLFSLVTELVVVVIAALLTEKIARKITGDTEEDEVYDATR